MLWLLAFGLLFLAGMSVLGLLGLRLARTGRLLAAEVGELNARLRAAEAVLTELETPLGRALNR